VVEAGDVDEGAAVLGQRTLHRRDRRRRDPERARRRAEGFEVEHALQRAARAGRLAEQPPVGAQQLAQHPLALGREQGAEAATFGQLPAPGGEHVVPQRLEVGGGGGDGADRRVVVEVELQLQALLRQPTFVGSRQTGRFEQGPVGREPAAGGDVVAGGEADQDRHRVGERSFFGGAFGVVGGVVAELLQLGGRRRRILQHRQGHTQAQAAAGPELGFVFGEPLPRRGRQVERAQQLQFDEAEVVGAPRRAARQPALRRLHLLQGEVGQAAVDVELGAAQRDQRGVGDRLLGAAVRRQRRLGAVVARRRLLPAEHHRQRLAAEAAEPHGVRRGRGRGEGCVDDAQHQLGLVLPQQFDGPH
jgi:hypothetical protein